jgi:hypothetical protein
MVSTPAAVDTMCTPLFSDLIENGLYIDLAPWRFNVFRLAAD